MINENESKAKVARAVYRISQYEKKIDNKKNKTTTTEWSHRQDFHVPLMQCREKCRETVKWRQAVQFNIFICEDDVIYLFASGETKAATSHAFLSQISIQDVLEIIHVLKLTIWSIFNWKLYWFVWEL